METVIITGGNAGLGFECDRELAASPDRHVIIACRDPDRGADAVARLAASISSRNLEAMALDPSVRRFATDLASRDVPPLRAIVCNAGIQIVTGRTYTRDGFETTFAVNHLGHFLLVNLLLSRLVAFVLPALRLLAPNVNGTRRSGRALARLVTDPRRPDPTGQTPQKRG